MNESKGSGPPEGRPDLRRSVFADDADARAPQGDDDFDDEFDFDDDDELVDEDDEDLDEDEDLDDELDEDDELVDEDDEEDDFDDELVDEDDEDEDEDLDEDDADEVEAELPHWTEPPVAAAAPAAADAWSALTGSQPRWRSEASDYDDPPEDPAALTVVAAEGSSEEFFEFDDEDDDEIDFESLADDDELATSARHADHGATAVPISKARAGVRSPEPKATGSPKAKAAAAARGGAKAAPKKSDIGSRVLTGIVLAALAVVAFKVGPAATVALAAVVLGLCAIELSIALQRAGYQPATLLSLVATVAAPIAVYNRGLDGLVTVLAITTAFSLLWFLSKAGDESPVLNAGVTVFTVAYIGLLGSYAALMLRLFGRHGIGMILAAVIGTIGHDIGALFIGRSSGRTKLTSVSPKKTREGLIGGMLVAIMAVVVFVGMFKLTPFGEAPKRGETFGLFYGGVPQAVWLGVVIAITAPLGDLVESLVKRDLGVKDMSNMLRGHGGVLDRFDAFLFTLPATYYLARFILL